MLKEQENYNKGGMIAFVFSMVVSFALFIYLVFLYPGIQIDKVRSQMPQGGEPTAVQAQAPAEKAETVDLSKIDEPWVSSDALVQHGQGVYKTNCAVCHGNSGAGDGPASAGLNVRNLIVGKWKQGGTSIELFNTMKNGVTGTSMAAFGHLPVIDRWALVHYIRSITKDKPADDPAKLKEFGMSNK